MLAKCFQCQLMNDITDCLQFGQIVSYFSFNWNLPFKTYECIRDKTTTKLLMTINTNTTIFTVINETGNNIMFFYISLQKCIRPFQLKI